MLTGETTHVHTEYSRHAREGCLHLKQASEVCRLVPQRTTAEIRQVKRRHPPPSLHTHTQSHKPWPLKEGDRWVFFFGQVSADSCPGYGEVRLCVCVSEVWRGWKWGCRETVKGQAFPGRKNRGHTQIYITAAKSQHVHAGWSWLLIPHSRRHIHIHQCFCLLLYLSVHLPACLTHQLSLSPLSLIRLLFFPD